MTFSQLLISARASNTSGTLASLLHVNVFERFPNQKDASFILFQTHNRGAARGSEGPQLSEISILPCSCPQK